MSSRNITINEIGNLIADVVIERINNEAKKPAFVDKDAVIQVAIEFIDQMRVRGCEGYRLPNEYDDLVDAVRQYR